jgi:hypothetical protein
MHPIPHYLPNVAGRGQDKTSPPVITGGADVARQARWTEEPILLACP